MASCSRRLAIGLHVLACALLVCATPDAGPWNGEGGGDFTLGELGRKFGGHGGGRRLLQMNTCQYDFSKVDYSSVTSVCKGPTYDAKTCCAPFTKLACQYQPQINDFNSLCPIYFLSYLNVAGGYSSGVFVGEGRCNKGNALCTQ